LDLKPGAHLNGFLSDITQGQAFDLMRLEGVTADGTHTVYDLRLSDVFMTQITDTNGVDHLELVYRKVSLTTTEQNPDGSLGASQSLLWDVPAGKSGPGQLPAAVAGSNGSSIVHSD